MIGLNILNNSLEKLFGSLEKPVMPEDKHILFGPMPQWVSVFAKMYTIQDPQNKWYKKPILLEACKHLFDFYCYSNKYAEKYGDKVFVTPAYQRRFPGPFIIALKLLSKELPDIHADCLNRCHLVATHFLEELKVREDFLFLTSANIGYGTNHLAVELYGLSEYLVNLNDQKPVEGLNKEYLKNYFDLMMRYMSPSGFWIECDGPALAYNVLTSVSLLRTAMLLNTLDENIDLFKTTAMYQAKTTFNNLNFIDCIDGRNTDRSLNCCFGTLLLNTHCHSLYKGIIGHLETKHNLPLNPDLLTHILYDIELQKQFPLDESPKEESNFYDEIPEGFSIKKKGPWKSAMCNMRFRPRPEGHWNLDYQSLISLYHDSFGKIFAGLNGKNDPWLSTFCMSLNNFDSTPVKEEVMIFIPDEGFFESNETSQKVTRNYRGFEASIELNGFKEDEIQLIAQAITRTNEYPVYLNLILPVKYGNSFKLENEQITLGDEKFSRTVSPKDTLYFLHEKTPNHLKAVTPKNLTIQSNANMEVLWPHIPFDPYNVEDDIQKDPNQHYCMLKVAIKRKQKIELTIKLA